MKVLITADIHLGNYSDYNYTTNSRLNQFDLLADRLLELKRENQCEEIWILGDFLRVPNSKQRVNNKLKSFIVKLCKNSSEVRFILGNHDTESKSTTQELEDSVLGLTDLISNFSYEDHTVHKWDNHYFAFMNWRPEQDLTWLDELGFDKVDVLLGHYTKSDLFGQEIDESRFDLMIHGDIHNDQVIGKFVSVCNPIQHDMSSQANGKVIILDTATLDWKHIEVDESHTRFLRIAYTDKKEEAGFKGPLQYYIYKPAKLGSTANQGFSTITWSDIDNLTNELVLNKGLLDIHSEVIAKCIQFNEIDFNFQLKKLEIKGYRSIVDFSMEFEPGDRVLLLGTNGSGKSSIIKALKGVFQKGIYLTYDRSDLADECLVSVELFYQNKLYKITKGDRWEFSIDGQQQNYNNKTEFENDIPEKLPFIYYLDLLFIMSDIQNLSGQFSPQRRIELLSRFYRLDKITAYNQTAIKLRDELIAKLNEVRGNRNTEQGILDHINSQLESYSDIKDEDQVQLMIRRTELESIRSKANAYKEYNFKHQNLLTNINNIESEKQKALIAVQVDIDLKVSEKDKLDQEIAQLYTDYQKNMDRANQYVKITTELETIMKRGQQLNAEINQLKAGVCPECGTLLSESKSKSLVEKRESELNDCREVWNKLDDQLQAEFSGVTDKFYFVNKNKDIQARLVSVKADVSVLDNIINNYRVSETILKSIQSRYDSAQTELATLELNKPEAVELLPDQSEQEAEVTRKLTRIDQYNKELLNKSTQESKINELESAIKVLVDKESSFNRYIELTSITGEIFEAILSKLAEQFSTDKVKYETESGIYRGKRYLVFNSYYFTKKYRIYESLSDGQKTVCDLDFLDKLFSIQVGVLVLDEHLKHLDEDNYQSASELLANMKTNTLIVSTHDPNYTNFTKRVLLKLDETGKTEYSVI